MVEAAEDRNAPPGRFFALELIARLIRESSSRVR
jgi:hypothetical protein